MEIWDAPWKGWNHAGRLLALPMCRLEFAMAGIRWGQRWQIFGRPIIQRYRGSRMEFGQGLSLRSTSRSNPLTPHGPVVLSTRSAQAVLRLGDNCGLTGAVVVAERSVTIGNRVLLGANAMVIDTDFHPLHPELRKTEPNRGAAAPIVIEDDVFVGTRAIVLKGVRLGAGCVVGAGAVVTKDVPARSVAAGNPARIVGSVDDYAPRDLPIAAAS